MKEKILLFYEALKMSEQKSVYLCIAMSLEGFQQIISS